MRKVLSAFAVLLLAAGLPFAAAAQDDINASLAPALGGVGTAPNGAGFNGALGDPVYLAENPGLYPPAVPNSAGVARSGVPAGEMAVPAPPGTYGPAPTRPAIEFFYNPR
jgi:hypothetical protein